MSFCQNSEAPSYQWLGNVVMHMYAKCDQNGLTSGSRVMNIFTIDGWTYIVIFVPTQGPRGDTLNFLSYVGSGPASTFIPPKKYKEFQAPQKIFEILATPKTSPFCTMPLRKDPKMHRKKHKIIIPRKKIFF